MINRQIKEKRHAQILIGADLVPTKSNFKYFKSGDIESLIGQELISKLNSADFTVFNLEVPLTDKEEPISKNGPNLIAPTYTVEGLKKINPFFFTLANNHILDQGEQGLYSTVDLLDRNGIAYAGAGKDLEKASRPFITDINGIRIGIYCCAEHEFTIATKTEGGANPYDPLESFDHVEDLKKNCDYEVVLYHGCKEYNRYPSPETQRIFHKFVDKGADLVIAQHSHCIGCEEDWNGGKIIYGQGNFLFDKSRNECWQTSLLIDVGLTSIEGVISSHIDYIPLRKQKERVRVALDGDNILSEFRKRSEEIKDSKKIEEHYKAFADSMLVGYLRAFLGKSAKGVLFRTLNFISGRRFISWHVKRIFGRQEQIDLINYIRCEAHREALLKGLTDLRNNDTDGKVRSYDEA